MRIVAENDGITAGVGGVYIDVHVQPGARRPLVGRHGGGLKIAVAAPAVEGRANIAVIKAIAEVLGISAGNISLVAGQTSRRKKLFAQGVNETDARRMIDTALVQSSRPIER